MLCASGGRGRVGVATGVGPIVYWGAGWCGLGVLQNPTPSAAGSLARLATLQGVHIDNFPQQIHCTNKCAAGRMCASERPARRTL